VVIDKTGLAGAFDFELSWKPEALVGKAEAANDDRLGIFKALQEQLGLRLEPTRAAIGVITIEHAEKPGES